MVHLQDCGRAVDMSTVGCGLYGRPKCHVIPTQSPNCSTHRALRAATRAAPTVDMSPQLISDVPEGGVPGKCPP